MKVYKLLKYLFAVADAGPEDALVGVAAESVGLAGAAGADGVGLVGARGAVALAVAQPLRVHARLAPAAARHLARRALFKAYKGGKDKKFSSINNIVK